MQFGVANFATVVLKAEKHVASYCLTAHLPGSCSQKEHTNTSDSLKLEVLPTHLPAQYNIKNTRKNSPLSSVQSHSTALTLQPIRLQETRRDRTATRTDRPPDIHS